MSADNSMQRWILTEAELAVVNPTRYPEIGTLNRDELADAARRIRRFVRTNLALTRHLPHDGRRAETPVARAAGHADSLTKAQFLIAALRRVNRSIKRFEKAERRHRASAIAPPHDRDRVDRGREQPVKAGQAGRDRHM